MSEATTQCAPSTRGTMFTSTTSASWSRRSGASWPRSKGCREAALPVSAGQSRYWIWVLLRGDPLTSLSQYLMLWIRLGTGGTLA